MIRFALSFFLTRFTLFVETPGLECFFKGNLDMDMLVSADSMTRNDLIFFSRLSEVTRLRVRARDHH